MFDLNSLVDYDEINALMGDDPLTLPRGQTGGNIAYSLVKTNTKKNTHFQMRQTSYHYMINNNAEQRSMLEAEENFKSFITDFCATNIEPLHSNCKIKMMIVISSFDSPLNTFFVQKSQFTPDIIYTLFYNAVQSRKKKGLLDMTDNDRMDIHLTVAETTNGAGKKKKPDIEEILCTNFVSYKKVKTLHKFCKTMPCIVPCDQDNH